MCRECGCSKPGPFKVDGLTLRNGAETHLHQDKEDCSHHHTHSHNRSHSHEHQVVDVNADLLDLNDRIAEQNRAAYRALNLLTLNVVSSPGSGKTTLLQTTLTALRNRLNAAVIVGDLATDNDAARLRTAGVPVVQISTGTLCHLESGMVAQAMKQLDLRALDLLVIENVGNLVCPAAFDLGEAVRVVLLSVTEGEDKPLKYPPMFHSADVVIVTKTDLATAAGFDRETALRNLRQSSPNAKFFELSARSGDGIATWCDYLVALKSRWLESTRPVSLAGRASRLSLSEG